MAEYIEREAAVHRLMTRGRYLTKDLVMDAAYEVSKIPAADVVEVVHGRWEDAGHGLVYKCSECGDLEDVRLSKFCPDCGARMDVES